MDLIQAYAEGRPLVFYETSEPDVKRLVAALVVMQSGVAVADANIFDVFASKTSAFLEGVPVGKGPWKVNEFTFEAIGPASELGLEYTAFQQTAPPNYKPGVEAWLIQEYR